MAAGNVSRVIRAPGRIVINPTDLSAAYPYGGTEIGKSRACVLEPRGTGFRIMSEGLGEPTDVLEASNEYVFSCFVRGWDDEAVSLLFSGGYTEGGVSKHAVYSEPGTTTPGASALGRAVTLLYVPDDVVHVPALLIYRGVPDWNEGTEISMQRGAELGMSVALECLRDGNGNILQVGLFADLSLTP